MKIWRICISLYTEGYKMHTHRLCNTHCFSTATVVARMHLSVTLYIHCLSVKLNHDLASHAL
jgi:hypothetical protein